VSAGCALCGLPVDATPVCGGGSFAERVYCCAGCARVDEVVAGLPEETRAATIKALAERLGIAPQRAAVASSLGAEAAGAAPAGTVVEERFRVSGMHCPSCAWLVERLLEARPGVTGARIDFLTGTGTARIDLRRGSRAEALGSLSAAGYQAVPLDADADFDPERLVLRLAVAAIATMNAMMLAWVHYAGLFGLDAGGWKTWIGALQAAIVVPAVGWSAAPIFRRAAALLRHGRAGMETLLGLGIAASLLFSCAGFFLPGVDFYFEIPAMITAAAMGSRLLERRIRRAGAKGVLELVRPRAERVRRAAPHRARECAAESGFLVVGELRAGDRILVPAGDEVPADVRVCGGAVTVDEGVLTGEAAPVVRGEGTTVQAGSRVVEGELLGEVLRPAAESAQAEIGRRALGLLAGAREQAGLGDRIAAWFVPGIVLAALGTAAGHAFLGGHGPGAAATWLPAIAVLVVACPCAFSIASAAAVGAAAVRLLREGVLVCEPRALDAAARVDTVVFDKTGTLTAGDMDVREVRRREKGAEAWLPAVAALEAHARHPAGRAVRRRLIADGVIAAQASAVEELPGLGVRGVVDGQRIVVGAPGLFDEAGDWPEQDGERTVVLFGPAARPAGAFLLDDPLRPGAPDAVAELRREGLDVRLLSGDDAAVVARVAHAAGIETHEGRVSPAGKAERVAALRANGRRVLYVGDGVNDAPALAAADVGLALSHGAGMACEVAGLVALRDEPRAAGRLVRTARTLGRIVRQNYAWALGYNAVLLPLAASGLLHPALAALAMFGSSVSVLANSARLLRGGAGG
jgi:heavy metal translocating P-type ATPase